MYSKYIGISYKNTLFQHAYTLCIKIISNQTTRVRWFIIYKSARITSFSDITDICNKTETLIKKNGWKEIIILS